MLPTGSEIMSIDSAGVEHADDRDGGWRHVPAGGRLLAAAKGLSATLTAPRRECRQVIRIFLASLGIGFALAAAATWAAATGLSTGPALRAKAPPRPAELVLASSGSGVAGARDEAIPMREESVEGGTFDSKLPAALPAIPPSKDAVAHVAEQSAGQTGEAASLQSGPPAHPISVPVPVHPSHTAVYDISAHTVYLPSGQTLEAHSGLGSRLDDPHAVRVKDRGPTPPNVYRLTLRDKRFHKVRAIRLIPTGEGKMFGRDGMLAHSYMRGASGESNGCVSFKNYSEFLRAYLNGEVDRLVVVTHLSPASWHTASAVFGPQLLDTN
jgi:Tlde1 domain